MTRMAKGRRQLSAPFTHHRSRTRSYSAGMARKSGWLLRECRDDCVLYVYAVTDEAWSLKSCSPAEPGRGGGLRVQVGAQHAWYQHGTNMHGTNIHGTNMHGTNIHGTNMHVGACRSLRLMPGGSVGLHEHVGPHCAHGHMQKPWSDA